MLAANGKTRFVWFTDRDLGPGITEHVSVGVTPMPHMIIDISGGPDATGYPVSIQYLLDVPASTGWTDEYKTTKIPMRWIRPEIFNRPGYTNDFPQVHENYWIAVFETTQRQYEMITGLKPSIYQGPMRPVENLSYQAITNFITLLKNKTGRKFNLPNNERWEYACRAGTISLCYDGTSNCVRKAAFAGSGSSVDLGRYADNCDDGKGGYAEHTTVGSYVPNAFGLYDCLGNVKEFNGINKEPYFPTNKTVYSSDGLSIHFSSYTGGDWKSDSNYSAAYVGPGKGNKVIRCKHSYSYLGDDYSKTNITSKSVSLVRVDESRLWHCSLPMKYGAGFYYGVEGLSYPLPELTELDVKAGFRIGCDAE